MPWDRMIREVILHMSLSVQCVAAIPLSYIPQGNHENHAEPCTQPLTEHEYDRSLQLRCWAPFPWVSIGAGSMSMPRELAASTRFTHPEGQPFKSTPALTQSPLSRSQMKALIVSFILRSKSSHSDNRSRSYGHFTKIDISVAITSYGVKSQFRNRPLPCT